MKIREGKPKKFKNSMLPIKNNSHIKVQQKDELATLNYETKIITPSSKKDKSVSFSVSKNLGKNSIAQVRDSAES